MGAFEEDLLDEFDSQLVRRPSGDDALVRGKPGDDDARGMAVGVSAVGADTDEQEPHSRLAGRRRLQPLCQWRGGFYGGVVEERDQLLARRVVLVVRSKHDWD